MSDAGAAALLRHLQEHVDPARVGLARDFTRLLLRRATDLALDTIDPASLASEIAETFRFVADRRPGELAIRTTIPQVWLNGPSLPGTVVEVCTEDRPFLLTTITEELHRLGHHVVRTLHPVLGVERDRSGALTAVSPARGTPSREALIHVELDERLTADQQREVREALRRVLHDAIDATTDFPRMRERVERLATELRGQAARGVLADEAGEVAAFLDWLLDDNFLLLGSREYEIVHGDDGAEGVRVVAGSGLGILADDDASRYARTVPLTETDERFHERHVSDRILTVARSHRTSTVRERARMLNIWVQRVDDSGRRVGQFRALGLFARRAHSVPSASIPVLRRKLAQIIEAEGIPENSHDERALTALFQAIPKDELFELTADELHDTLLGLLRAEERHEITVRRRVDPAIGEVSMIIGVPRDRYDARFREQVERLLIDRYGGSGVEVHLSLGERPQAVARFSVRTPQRDIPDVPLRELEAEIRSLARSWLDELRDVLIARDGEPEGRRLLREYGRRLPATYQEHNAPDPVAADDIAALDRLVHSGEDLDVRLHGDPLAGSRLTRLKAIKRGHGIELSRILPILESLGLTVTEELPFRLTGDGIELHIHDYGVRHVGASVDDDADGSRLASAVLAAWGGRLEVDSLNRLVVRAGIAWEDLAVLRAYRRYRRQVGTVYTADYINDALVEHPAVSRALVAYFDARFDPDRLASPDDVDAARDRVVAALEQVQRLDHDRILRAFLALVDATLRTNRYRHGVSGRLALKFDSGAVPQAPKPVPHCEIFVYAPSVEGIHLRGGPVARGGVRWSDRRDDVRTEVLGLMRAQVLKNAVIVPTGAKGGFVLKRPPADRQALAAEVERQYRTFIRALLDVTDNVVGDEVVAPDRVRRRDGDDAYLVVAADRGTATFSDIANAVADEYGFWLGDAFASGGSRGYDHKRLGITARGVWVAIRRHFHELGIDVEHEQITVAGIGDMSGDVFGNGMLQSSPIRLIAAFDHRDIFLDPDPDPQRAFTERQRLFGDPRLSWQDYDRDAISVGGGVWSRDEKWIPLSPRLQELLRVDAGRLPPPAVVRAILEAPVDLLFAGGIGTFVKASHESNSDIGDRANDEIRVDARRLRARVVAEGANLAVTQPARIEYARRGGRLNTDFIDNSAGVDLSDHEVNLKILLRLVPAGGDITSADRDAVLEAVVEEVVAACLRDVELQTWLLSYEAAVSPSRIEAYEALIVHLETTGTLDRDVEALPTTEAMEERRAAGAGLTRPELAVILAATKRDLSAELVGSQLPDQPALNEVLAGYFPPLLAERFGGLLDRHRLRRELVATVMSNEVVNRMGMTFVHRLARELGAEHATVVAACWTARKIADAERYWDALEDVDRRIDPMLAIELKAGVDAMLETLTREYVRSAELTEVAAVIARDRPAFEALEATVTRAWERRSDPPDVARFVDRGLQADTARWLLAVNDLDIAPDVAGVARALGEPPADVAAVFLALREELGLDRLRRLLDRAVPRDRWGRWHVRGLRDDLRGLHRTAAHRALREHRGGPAYDAVRAFITDRQDAVARSARLIDQAVAEEGSVRLDAVAVAVRALREALQFPYRPA
ncbi:MAG: NAD-glutamate dehydrogenase [Actinomycetota bacterium]|nr:NAD-glutamate dehydrogenase [Actinomycetota bacterium]